MSVTFARQAECFMTNLINRKRRPIKPATRVVWESCIRVHLTPALGTLPLSEVGNLAMKDLVAKLSTTKLSAKSITNYVQIAKMIVGSAINENGEPLYARKWNSDFIDLPEVRKQNTPI